MPKTGRFTYVVSGEKKRKTAGPDSDELAALASRANYTRANKLAFNYVTFVLEPYLWTMRLLVFGFILLFTVIITPVGLGGLETYDDEFFKRLIPSGSRMEEVYDDFAMTSSSPEKASFLFVMMLNDDGDTGTNVFTRERILQLHNFVVQLGTITYSFKGKSWSLGDLCYRPTKSEAFEDIVPLPTQCIRMIPTDCFHEGSFDRPDFMDSLWQPANLMLANLPPPPTKQTVVVQSGEDGTQTEVEQELYKCNAKDYDPGDDPSIAERHSMSRKFASCLSDNCEDMNPPDWMAISQGTIADCEAFWKKVFKNCDLELSQFDEEGTMPEPTYVHSFCPAFCEKCDAGACTFPDAGDSDESKLNFMKCLKDGCKDMEDEQMMAITSNDLGSCKHMTTKFSCTDGEDLSSTFSMLPPGTTSKDVCANTCGNCRRLASHANATEKQAIQKVLRTLDRRLEAQTNSQGLPTKWYLEPTSGLPSIHNVSDADLGKAFAHGCPDNLMGFTYRDASYFTSGAETYGGPECTFFKAGRRDYGDTEGETCIRSAPVLRAMYPLENDGDLSAQEWTASDGTKFTITKEEAEKIEEGLAEQWESAASEQKDVYMGVMTRSTLKRAIEETAAAPVWLFLIAILAMLVFAVASNLDKSGGLALEATLGIFVVVAAVASSFGLFVLCFEKVDAGVLQIVPFFSFGIGVDDMFIYMHCFLVASQHQREDLDAWDRLGFAMAEAWTSVTVTSVSNFMLFLFAAIVINIPMQSSCALALMIAVIINYIFLIMAMPLILQIRMERWFNQEEVVVVESEEDMKAHAAAAAESGAGRKSVAADTLQQRNIVGMVCGAKLRGLPVQALLVVIWIAFSIVMGVLTSEVASQNSYVDLFPSDTKAYKMAYYYEKYSSDLMVNLVMKGSDFGGSQLEVAALADKVKADLGVDCIPWTWMINPWAAYHHPDKTYTICRSGGAVLNEGKCTGDEGEDMVMIKPEHWNEMWAAYITPVGKGLYDGSATFADFLAINKWIADGSGNVKLAWMSCFGVYAEDEVPKTEYGGGQARLETAQKLNEIAESAMGGTVYAVSADQIMANLLSDSSKVFWTGMAAGLAAIFVCSAIILWNVLASLVMVIMAVMTMIQIYGLLHVFQIPFNINCALALMTACGLSIEFCAHVLVATQHAKGSAPQRVQSATLNIMAPILMGGFSSIIGVLPIWGSKLDVVVTYFCHVNILSCAVALINALIFLPAVYTFVGMIVHGYKEQDIKEKEKPPTAIGNPQVVEEEDKKDNEGEKIGDLFLVGGKTDTVM